MTPRRRRVAAALAVLAAWTILAAIFTPQHYVLSRRPGGGPPWWQLFVGNLVMFWVWAAMTPAVLWFGRRFPLERTRAARTLLLYFVAGFAFTLTHIVIVRYANAILSGTPPQPVFNYLVGFGATGVLIAWAVLAASQAIIYFRRYQDREFRLVQAELQSLKIQLQPHFLFNTLNAIAELLHSDARRAEQTIAKLSDLLRHALNRSAAQELPLQEEIEFLRAYVHIQQTLLQERLTVRWLIEDDTLDACVPAMLLQPLVENAVRHGVAPRARGGTVEISARREGAQVVIGIDDDGVGLAGGHDEGIGIANTRARLRHMYGEGHTFEVRERDTGGVSVRIVMPFLEARA